MGEFLVVSLKRTLTYICHIAHGVSHGSAPNSRLSTHDTPVFTQTGQ